MTSVTTDLRPSAFRCAVTATCLLGLLTSAGCDGVRGGADRAKQDTSGGGSYASSPHGGDGTIESTSVVDFDALSSLADPVTSPTSIGDRYGIDATFLKTLGGRELVGVWMSKEGSGGTPWIEAVYGSDVLVHVYIEDLASVAEAAAEAIDRSVAPHVTVVDVNGTRGYARPRVRTELKLDRAGEPVPGTGVETGASTIRFSAGRCAVTVLSPTMTTSQLLPFARALRLVDRNG